MKHKLLCTLERDFDDDIIFTANYMYNYISENYIYFKVDFHTYTDRANLKWIVDV